MTVYQHAAQIWSVLALAARNRQVLSYDIIGRLVDVPHFGLGRHLEPIQSYCLTRALPPLTALVVSQDSGLPGTGFIAAPDVPRAQNAVFAHDWLNEEAPPPEALEDAVRRQPSNGIAASSVTQAAPAARQH